MRDKIFKTLDEQISIFREKGLIINDEAYAKEILLRENYFFLNGYRHPFMKSIDNRVYIPGTTFEEIYSLFLFDRKLRNIIFKNILIIENNVKSIISYQLSKKYGYKEKDYLNPKNFNYSTDKRRQINDLLGKMKKQISANASQHAATMHYINNYGYIPLWVLVKVLSFGIVSELYSILKKEDQYEVADFFDVDADDFVVYLVLLSNYRNLCAHEDIVYENRTQKSINDCQYHKLLNIQIINEEYEYGKNDLFALVIIICSMLKPQEVKDFIIELESDFSNLEYNLKTIPINKIMDRMGFPSNYRNIVEIREKFYKKNF